ncbi:Copine-8 [Echinococcus granulosus]|uniref:Copine-8 n=1 Tax=Echinococcus granulosus TaxID=6210 RepID=W6UDS7_ECHGR|nr:Copine-8 [Echinococcus granulosus]EUB59510.1 Copine-8 [Echinococcus granulosus]
MPTGVRIQLGFSFSTELSVGRTIHSGGEDEAPLRAASTDAQASNNEGGSFNASVILCTREEPSTKENIVLKMRGVGLDKKDMFGKSDPYIIILRRNDRGKWEQCYQSEVVKKTLAPDWKPLLISLDRLCDGNLDSEICFRCFDWDGANGEGDTVDPDIDDVIGEFITTARCLLTCSQEGRNFELINRSKFRRKKVYNNSGIVNVKVSISTNACSFLDYILSGTSINVIVGIDLSSQIHQSHNPMLFTEAISIAKSAAVNSEYIIAIQAVVEILQEYDSDELFPAFGFGTRIGSDGRKSHLVPLTGDLNNPNCKGVSGVLAAYSRVVSETCGSAPPNFAPLIRHVNEMAKGSHDSSKYFVLLILTTGFVDDWVETQRAVIEVELSQLQVLDQDFALLKVGSEEACRDNVQYVFHALEGWYMTEKTITENSALFVEMRRFLRLAADGSEEIRWNKLGLAKEVLAELPTQLFHDAFIVPFDIRISNDSTVLEVKKSIEIKSLERKSFWKKCEQEQRLEDAQISSELSPRKRVPYRPERADQLADSAWCHAYMQPLHHRPSTTSLSSQTSLAPRHKQKLRFQEDVENLEKKEEVQNTASNSHRCLSMSKTAPAEVAETPPRQTRKLGRMRREVSFEDPSFRHHRVVGGNRQITYELIEDPAEDTLVQGRHQSWRGRPENIVSESLSQRQLSQQRDDMVPECSLKAKEDIIQEENMDC